MNPIITIAITLITLITGVTLSLSYELPEVKIYNEFNDFDHHMLSCENQPVLTLTQSVQQLDDSVTEIINVGKTYTKEVNVSEYFIQYQNNYTQLQQKLESIANCKYEFVGVDKKISSKLPTEIQTLMSNLSETQTERFEKFDILYKDLSDLLVDLEPLEKIFYTSNTREAIEYFRAIENKLSKVYASHNAYMNSYETYIGAKTELYQGIQK